MGNKMWGGRFTSSPSAIMEDINASIEFDRHLYRQDIAASKAHAEMLAKQGIITADDLARMKPTALLVNTSRAPIIAEGALVEALRRGRPGFAAVDVFEQEPVVGGAHPLLHLPNALCTPHLGYAERDSYESLYALAVDQLLAFAAGKPINVANPEAVGKR